MVPPYVVQSMNFSYPSQTAILTYLTLKERKKLVKWIPALRVTHKKAPFMLETVVLSSKDNINFVVQFDDFIWRFQTENEAIWAEGAKMNLVNKEGIVLKKNLSIADAHRIVKFFLEWRALRIKNLRVDGSYQVPAELYKIKVIETLRVRQKQNIEICLESFLDTNIGRLELYLERSDADTIDKISKIKCDDVKIYVLSREIDVSFVVALPFKKLQITEKYLNIDRYCDFVEKLRAGHNEKGSAYIGYHRGNSDEVWLRVKHEFRIKVEHPSFLIIGTHKSDCELLVERWEQPGYDYGHSVKVIEHFSEEQKRFEHSYFMRTLRVHQRVLTLCLRSSGHISMFTLYFFLTLSSVISLPFSFVTFYFITVPINVFQLISAVLRFILFLISYRYAVHYTWELPDFLFGCIALTHFFVFMCIFADIPINHLYYLETLGQPMCIGGPLYNYPLT